MSSLQTHNHLRLVRLTGIDRVAAPMGRLALQPRRRPRFRAAALAAGQLAKKLSLFLAGCLLALVLSEVGLYLSGFAYPVCTQSDPDRGFAYCPGMSFVHGDEGRAQIQISQHGFRDCERPLAKPANTVRIAVLGDSYTAAVQVEQQDRFTEVLERELNRQGVFDGKKIEVLNFGTSGYGTAQELMTLRQQVWNFQPDVVMLAFLTGNDIRNNSEVLERDSARPYFRYDGGDLVLDDSFRNNCASWTRDISLGLAKHLRLAQVAYRVRHMLKGWTQTRQFRDGSNVQSELYALGLSQPGLDIKIYAEPEDADWTNAWQVTEGLISQMNREVTARGAQFMVVTLSNAVQVHPDPAARTRFMELVGSSNLFYPDERIKRAAETEAIPVLNLAPALQQHAEQHQVHLHGFANTRLGSGHWNAEGHRQAGKLIATWMAKLRDRRYETETITVSAQ